MKNSLKSPNLQSKTKTLKYQAAGVVTLLLLWQLVAVFINQPFILPQPAQVIKTLIKICTDSGFWSIAFSTLLRWLMGLLPAYLLGITLGALSAYCESIGAFLHPFFTLIKSVPVVSIILLSLIWFKAPFVPSFVVFLAVFPSAVDNTAAGVKNIDKKLLDMASVYKVSPANRIFLIFLPSIQPFLFAALRTGVGIGLKATVVAELVVQPAISIGAELQKARVYLDTDVVLAWTFFIVICGYIAERLVTSIEKRALFWRQP